MYFLNFIGIQSWILYLTGLKPLINGQWDNASSSRSPGSNPYHRLSFATAAQDILPVVNSAAHCPDGDTTMTPPAPRTRSPMYCRASCADSAADFPGKIREKKNACIWNCSLVKNRIQAWSVSPLPCSMCDRTSLARVTLRIDSPWPVQDTAPLLLSAYPPQPGLHGRHTEVITTLQIGGKTSAGAAVTVGEIKPSHQ